MRSASGSLADLALAGQEDEHVAAGALARELVHRVEHRLLHVLVFLVLVRGFERAVAHFDRIGAARHFDHRRAVEMLREALGLDRRRGDDHLEIGAPRQQALQIPEQEVDVEAALVRLVDDDRVVGSQQPVALRLGEQDAVGHHLDVRVGRELVGEAHLVADRVAERALQLLRDARRHRARGDAARLRVADESVHAAPELEADLRKLRGLARAGLAADDDDLVLANRARDLLPPRDDRKVVGVARLGEIGETLCGIELHLGERRASRIESSRAAAAFPRRTSGITPRNNPPNEPIDGMVVASGVFAVAHRQRESRLRVSVLAFVLIAFAAGHAGAAQRSSSEKEQLQEARELQDRGRTAEGAGRYAEALGYLERALAIRERLLGREHPAVSATLFDLGVLHRHVGAYGKALPFMQRSLAIRESARGEDHKVVGLTLSHLAWLYRELGDYERAIPLAQRSLAIREKALGRDHYAVASSLNNLSITFGRMGDYESAIVTARRALSIHEQGFYPFDWEISTSLNNLGLALEIGKQDPEGLPLLERALRVASFNGPPRYLVRAYRSLARVHARRGRADLAILFGKHAVNQLQSMRQQITDLDPELQQGFLDTNEQDYQFLAGLLIETGPAPRGAAGAVDVEGS